MGTFFIMGRKPFIIFVSKKYIFLFQGSTKSSLRLSGFICRKLLERLMLPNFGAKIKKELINTPVEIRFKAINDILLQLLDGDGKKRFVEELLKSMTGAPSYWQLLHYPIDVFMIILIEIIGADEKFAVTVGKLSSVFSSVKKEFFGLLMPIFFWIISEFVAWFITKLLVQINRELQTEKLLEGVTVTVADMVVSVMNYIYACVLSADKWVTLMKERSEKFLRRNAELAETLVPIEMNLIN